MKDLLKLALVLAPLLCAASLAQQSVEHPVQVSMLQLIATPEKFNGTIVAVQGPSASRRQPSSADSVCQ
jgi:hypothetical protein